MQWLESRHAAIGHSATESRALSYRVSQLLGTSTRLRDCRGREPPSGEGLIDGSKDIERYAERVERVVEAH
jgi:hypothetical protein